MKEHESKRVCVCVCVRERERARARAREDHLAVKHEGLIEAGGSKEGPRLPLLDHCSVLLTLLVLQYHQSPHRRPAGEEGGGVGWRESERASVCVWV